MTGYLLRTYYSAQKIQAIQYTKNYEYLYVAKDKSCTYVYQCSTGDQIHQICTPSSIQKMSLLDDGSSVVGLSTTSDLFKMGTYGSY